MAFGDEIYFKIYDSDRFKKDKDGYTEKDYHQIGWYIETATKRDMQILLHKDIEQQSNTVRYP